MRLAAKAKRSYAMSFNDKYGDKSGSATAIAARLGLPTDSIATNAAEPAGDEMPQKGPSARHHFAKARDLLSGEPGERECRMAIAHISHAQAFLGDTD
jgi:hypothetical protein